MQATATTPIQKLQTLCSKVNTRYAAGLNDDDQVKAMFDYQKKHPELIVIIGYDKYQAITKEQLKEYAKTAQEDESRTKESGSKYIKFWHNRDIYSAKIENI